MALGSTQPLTEMSTRNVSWGQRRPVLRADNLHVPNVLKSGSLNLLEPSGPVQACNGISLPLPLYFILRHHTELFCGSTMKYDLESDIHPKKTLYLCQLPLGNCSFQLEPVSFFKLNILVFYNRLM
jgi:hypothetical protein